jgi:hypothetical protein
MKVYPAISVAANGSSKEGARGSAGGTNKNALLHTMRWL